MTDIEKVDRLREKADVTFAEAKAALEAANGDILDALIHLESLGKAVTPAGGGFFSGAATPEKEQSSASKNENSARQKNESFPDMMRRFRRFIAALIRKGNRNFLEATRGEQHMFSCPVTAVALFLLFFFWLTIPLFIISLFCGFRYHFRGEDLGHDSVNRVMGNASNIVENVKNSLTDNEDDED